MYKKKESTLTFDMNSAHVSFPAEAGTSPEGHEEACTTTDRVHGHRPTAPRGRRLDSLARCCAPDAGSYTIYSERREPRVASREVGGEAKGRWREGERGRLGLYTPEEGHGGIVGMLVLCQPRG